MNYFSQKDKRWSGKKLGTCNTTIGTSGCFITSLAMLDGRTPDVINDLLKNNGGYSGGCNLLSDKAAQILGLQYLGKTIYKPGFTCIAETDHYKSSGFPQHFFIIFPDGHINDPLSQENISNPYHIVSYRQFKEKVDSSQNSAQNIDMVPKELLKDHLFSDPVTGKIYWHINGPDEFNKYINAWDLVNPFNEIIDARSATVDCQTKLTSTEKALTSTSNLLTEASESIESLTLQLDDEKALNKELNTKLEALSNPVPVITPSSEQPKKHYGKHGSTKLKNG